MAAATGNYLSKTDNSRINQQCSKRIIELNPLLKN
jgi:hypothetical protein